MASTIPELGPVINAVAGFFGVRDPGGKVAHLPGEGTGSPGYFGPAAARFPVPLPPLPPPAAESPDMLAVGGHPGTAGTAPGPPARVPPRHR